MIRSKRPRSQSTSPSKTDFSKCTICEEPATDDALECTWCERVQHRTCCKISVEQCAVLGKLTDNIVFLCSACMPNLSLAFKLYDDSSAIESKIQSMEINLLDKLNLITDSYEKTIHAKASTSMQQVESLCDSIKKKHDKLQNDFSSLTNKMNDMHQNIQSKLNSLSSQVVQPPATHHSTIEAMNELEDRNRRKCNLIVHKLPDSEDSKDEETFLSICKDVLGLDVKIVTIKRLGQQRGLPRLLLVVLENEDIKRQILARSPRLRQSDSWKTVFITPDLTRQEREEGKR